jgi:hypothetical protein
MKLRGALAFVLSFQVLVGQRARAAEQEGLVPATPARLQVTPAGLLAAADAAVGAGDLPLARSLFERVIVQFPASSEANEARRALKLITVRLFSPNREAPGSTEARADGEATPDGDDVVVRNEPYSLKTSERLRLTIWEKVDFSVTAFLYGMSVGLSLGLSGDLNTASDVLTPVALGAVAYTLGSVAFLKLANPDRGDLPLALAITSYVPTTTLLLLNAADPHVSEHVTGVATAVAGLVSVPVAVVASQQLNLDPGDTQLVRDAGFWGLAISTVGMLGFAGQTSEWGYYQEPTDRQLSVAGLIGLYGGLGLGLVAASTTEMSLERVRVTTWGGYGGAVVGLLIGAAADDGHDIGLYRGMALGALGGLLLTLATTGSLDGIPDEEATRQSWYRRLNPTMVHLSGRDGRYHPGLGVGGTLF